MIALSIAVQHHPLRAHLIQPLLERVGGFDLVTDPDPDGIRNPMRTYRVCLRRTPEHATHRLVLQDDAWPCRDFHARAEAALAEHPDSLVCFFIPGAAGGGRNRVLRAALARERWAQIGAGGWVPVIAVGWPAALIEPFLEFSEFPRNVANRSDDELLTRFVKANRLEVWATVPSLVEHPDIEESLIGRQNGAGKIRSRVAEMLEPDH